MVTLMANRRTKINPKKVNKKEYRYPIKVLDFFIEQDYRVFPITTTAYKTKQGNALPYKSPMKGIYGYNADFIPADMKTKLAPKALRRYAEQGYMFGICGKQSGVLIIDVDVSGDKVGLESLDRLERDLGDIDLVAEYPTVVTGTGGLHIYMKVPNRKDYSDSFKEYQDIDLRYKGYVVAPGSINKDGRVYTLHEHTTRDDFLHMPNAPKALLDMLLLEGDNRGGRTAKKTGKVNKRCPQGLLTPEELTELLGHFDPNDYWHGDNGTWIAFIGACKHATAKHNEDETGLEELLDFTTHNDEYNTPQAIKEVQAVWKKTDIETGNDADATVFSLVKSMEDYGAGRLSTDWYKKLTKKKEMRIGMSNDPRDDFDVIPMEERRGTKKVNRPDILDDDLEDLLEVSESTTSDDDLKDMLAGRKEKMFKLMAKKGEEYTREVFTKQVRECCRVIASMKKQDTKAVEKELLVGDTMDAYRKYLKKAPLSLTKTELQQHVNRTVNMFSEFSCLDQLVAEEFNRYRIRNNKPVMFQPDKKAWWRYRDGVWHSDVPGDTTVISNDITEFYLENHPGAGGNSSAATKPALEYLTNCRSTSVLFDGYEQENPFSPRYSKHVHGVATKNKTILIDIDKGTYSVEKHDPDNLQFSSTNYRYNKNADCPVYHAFLNSIFRNISDEPREDGSPSDRAQLLRWWQKRLCYTLTYKRTGLAQINYGDGKNGKSALQSIEKALIGHDAVRTFDIASAGDDKFATSGNERKKVIHVPEMDSPKDIITMIKAISTNEEFEAQAKYGNRQAVYNTAYINLNTNSVIQFPAGSGKAVKRRIVGVPFTYEATQAEKHKFKATYCEGKDPEVYIIENELPGILNWALEALPELHAEEYEVSDEYLPPFMIKCRDELFLAGTTEGSFIQEFIGITTTPMYLDRDVWATLAAKKGQNIGKKAPRIDMFSAKLLFEMFLVYLRKRQHQRYYTPTYNRFKQSMATLLPGLEPIKYGSHKETVYPGVVVRVSQFIGQFSGVAVDEEFEALVSKLEDHVTYFEAEKDFFGEHEIYREYKGEEYYFDEDEDETLEDDDVDFDFLD